VGSIYHHFGGKEGLAAAVLLEAFADYQHGALQALEGDPSAEDGVKGLARHHAQWIAAHPDQVRFILGPRDPAVELAGQRAFKTMNRAFLRKVGAWRARRVSDGSLRDVPPGQFYALLIGPGQEYARLWFEGRGDLPDEDVAEEFARAAWQALRNDLTA
jgi:AcrR family transcriptional regulator